MDLPNEIWNKIFDNLSVVLLKKALFVSKRWKELILRIILSRRNKIVEKLKLKEFVLVNLEYLVFTEDFETYKVYLDKNEKLWLGRLTKYYEFEKCLFKANSDLLDSGFYETSLSLLTHSFKVFVKS